MQTTANNLQKYFETCTNRKITKCFQIVFFMYKNMFLTYLFFWYNIIFKNYIKQVFWHDFFYYCNSKNTITKNVLYYKFNIALIETDEIWALMTF